MGSPSQLHAAVRDALAEIPDGLTPEQRVGAVRALLERSRNAHRARRRINELLESALEWAATAPRCPCDAVGRQDAAHPECSACEVFVCARCDRWVSWDEGADDETPYCCDDCWQKVGASVELTAPPGQDLRHFDARGRFNCTPEHPWSGRREDAPRGVNHANAIEYDGTWDCPDCGATWSSR